MEVEVRLALTAVLAAFLFVGVAQARQAGPSDDDIAQVLIEESIASYPGPCACPYNVTRNGRSCGRRSAYSKPGGYSPLCYREDVSDDSIQNYRRRHGLAGLGKR